TYATKNRYVSPMQSHSHIGILSWMNGSLAKLFSVELHTRTFSAGSITVHLPSCSSLNIPTRSPCRSPMIGVRSGCAIGDYGSELRAARHQFIRPPAS